VHSWASPRGPWHSSVTERPVALPPYSNRGAALCNGAVGDQPACHCEFATSNILNHYRTGLPIYARRLRFCRQVKRKTTCFVGLVRRTLRSIWMIGPTRRACGHPSKWRLDQAAAGGRRGFRALASAPRFYSARYAATACARKMPTSTMDVLYTTNWLRWLRPFDFRIMSSSRENGWRPQSRRVNGNEAV
jgi:hypothetical protein